MIDARAILIIARVPKLVEMIKELRREIGSCASGQDFRSELRKRCQKTNAELGALAIMLTGDPNMFQYKLPPTVKQ